MKTTKKALYSVLFILALPALCLSLSRGPASAEEPENESRLYLEEWLMLGPVSTPFPAFSEETEGESGTGFLLSQIFIRTEDLRPSKGVKVEFPVKQAVEWSEAPLSEKAVYIGDPPGHPSIAFLASYLEVTRWTEVEIGAKCSLPFKLIVDGEQVIKSDAGGWEEYENGKVKLEKGKHTVIVKTVFAPRDTAVAWRFSAFIDSGEDYIGLSTNPERPLNINDILDPPVIRDLTLSPDGKLAALVISRILPPDGERESSVEIRDASTGSLKRTFPFGEKMGRLRWLPTGSSLSYTASEGGKTSLKMLDLDSNKERTIIDGVERFEGYSWSRDGGFVVYSAGNEIKEKEEGYKRLRGIYDRTDYGRNVSCLYLASAADGAVRKLTTGEYSSRLADIHPDGGKILVTRRYEDLSERPYGKTELAVVDLEASKAEVIWQGRWFNDASWSPDGSRILVQGGASMFGDNGRNVPEGIIPNDYDGQIYIFDPETGEADPITKEFAPAVRWARWSEPDGKIYILAEDMSSVKLFVYSPGNRKITPLDTACDVIRRIDIPRGRPVALYTGLSADTPQKLFRLDLRSGKEKELLDPSEGWFDQILKTRVEDWNFTSASGKEIIGRIHYPPRFDPEKTYPCIVYYYGGTSPVTRDFGGRYPKNLWASMGYVVYVLQPSGATGFGQEFSAKHVNDWGKTVAGEIIEGTGKFLEAHPFVDPERVGCIGASFGGFMTQLLVTRTDIFAAAVSHAGISSISSYWGEGYWGYAYNAVSAANSFPWNRPDIYIGQSPLFSADKINTPLLLLHGDSDTNVPPGESEQMYTALKLLGKPVEYIRFAGQNHFILDYKKRIRWSNSILAWFDRWLKDEPDWWNDMYPPLGPGVKESPETGEPEPMGPVTVDDDKYGTFLAGEISREDIGNALPGWDAGYFEYEPDMEAVAGLMESIEGTDITCVLGTWCGDSRRMVPRLWKVLESAGFDNGRLRMVAISSSRFEPDAGAPEGIKEYSDSIRDYFGVQAVPTVIVKRNGKELGRIIETVAESVEKDLLLILAK